MRNERENEITYRKEGDYYIPNLIVPKDEYPDYCIGKYGRLRLNYLKEHKKAEYTIMLMNGTLRKHIVQIDIDAKNRVENIVNSLKSQSDLTEEMKNFDPLYWVGMMNNFKNQAEEIVLKELIYV
jgi:tnpV protein